MQWFRIYGRICRELRITPREAKRLRLTEAAMLWRYWSESPSIDDLFAGFVGWKPAGAEDRVSSEEEILAFALFAGGTGGGRG